MVVTIYFDDDADDTETLPARLAGNLGHHRTDRLQPRVGAGQGDPRQPSRRDRHLHRAQRRGHQGHRRQLRAVRRLSRRSAVRPPPGVRSPRRPKSHLVAAGAQRADQPCRSARRRGSPPTAPPPPRPDADAGRAAQMLHVHDVGRAARRSGRAARPAVPGRSGQRTVNRRYRPAGGQSVLDHPQQQQRVDVAAGEHRHGRRLDPHRRRRAAPRPRPHRPARPPACSAPAASAAPARCPPR